ncbi:MAG TPA: hypothetical protein VM492_18225 [Sumerlaeia bacterium]|nr:hypothetical protein [Sumerlaeia bacterium]
MTRKQWGIVLFLAYAVSFLFSHGPGILPFNKADLVLGFPVLYLWAVGWYAVQLAIVVAAYRLVWKEEEE